MLNRAMQALGKNGIALTFQGQLDWISFHLELGFGEKTNWAVLWNCHLGHFCKIQGRKSTKFDRDSGWEFMSAFCGQSFGKPVDILNEIPYNNKQVGTNSNLGSFRNRKANIGSLTKGQCAM